MIYSSNSSSVKNIFNFLKILIENKKLFVLILFISISFFVSEYVFVKIIKSIVELFKENPKIILLGLFASIFTIIIIFRSSYTPIKLTDTILVYLLTIGALLLVFAPQGLFVLNDKYTYKGFKKLYNIDELSIKNANISHYLINFTALILFDILITPPFFYSAGKSKNSKIIIVTIHHYIVNYLFKFKSNGFLEILSVFYVGFIINALLFLMLGLIEILSVIRYFYDYDYKFKKLKSEYPNWNNSQILWIIQNDLVEKTLVDYIVYSIDDFIMKFDNFKNLNPLKTKKEIFKTMIKLDKFSGLISKRPKNNCHLILEKIKLLLKHITYSCNDKK
jgi:hypothetical protein